MSRPQKLRSSLRINVQDVRLGMFIAELDRPWSDTPFLLQGFLLEDPADLGRLRELTREVTIDPLRCASAALAHLPWDALHLPAEVDPVRVPRPAVGHASGQVTGHIRTTSPAPGLWSTLKSLLGSRGTWQPGEQPQQYYLRFPNPNADSNPGAPRPAPRQAGGSTGAAREATLTSALTPPSTAPFSAFIAAIYPRDVGFSFSFFDTARLWWHQRDQRRRARAPVASATRAPVQRRLKDRPDFLPKNMPLVMYHDQASVVEESVRANAIVERADVVLAKMVSDIQADLPVTLEAVQPVVDTLVDSVISNPAALMWSARMRDESKKTYMHGLKVAVYLMALGRHLGFPKEQLSELGSIGLLLDIGMLKMPASLLEKTGELTPEENAQLHRHVDYAIEALEQNDPLPRFVARGIQEHHERIDGSGYPLGLAGTDISVYGRMAAIADTFAAMTTARAYDVTHSAFDAMKELFKEAESKLHAPLVEQFVQAISIFPVGSLIELSTGEVAIVLEHNGVRRLEPTVLVLTDADKEMLAQPYTLALLGGGAEGKKILRGLADGAYGIDYRDYYLN